MRNTFKRVLSFILALTMVLGLGVTAFAAPKMASVNIYYGLNKGEVGDEPDVPIANVASGTLFKKVLSEKFPVIDVERGINSFEKWIDALESDWNGNWDRKFYSDSAFTNLIDYDSATVNSALKVYINIENDDGIVIELDANGGTCDKDKIVAYSGSAMKLPTPTKVGYEFLGWKDNAGNLLKNGDKYLDGYTKLTAEWKNIPTTIYFDVDGATIKSGKAEMTVENAGSKIYGHDINDALVGLVTEKPGYSLFTYSYKGVELANADDSFTIDEDMYLGNEQIKFVWVDNGTPRHTVTFNPNGGQFAEGSQTVVEVIDGQTLGAFPVVTKTGYGFEGWYNESDQQYTTETKIYGAATLKAKWLANAYNVIFDYQDEITGKNPVSYPVKNGEAIGGTFTAVVLDAEGYNFDGWYSDAERTTKAAIPTGTWNLTGDVTYYAKYTPKTYNVEVYDGAKSKVVETVTATYGEDFTVPTAEAKYNDCPFVGWKVQVDEANYEVKENTFVWKYDGNAVMLIPLYSDTKEFTVTFKKPDGTADVVKTYAENAPIGEFPEVEPKAGNTVKWYFDNAEVSVGTKVKNNYTFVAKYVADTYNATFKKADGQLVTIKTFNYGDYLGSLIAKVTPPTPETGYKFAGWRFNGKVYDGTSKDVIDVEGGIMLLAEYEAIIYTVTLDANGGVFSDGSSTKQFTIKYGETYGDNLVTPERKDGVAFKNWKYDSTPVDENTPFGAITNITLKAEWDGDVTAPHDYMATELVIIDTWDGSTIYDSTKDMFCYTNKIIEAANYVGLYHKYNGINELIYNSGTVGKIEAHEAGKYGYTPKFAYSKDGEGIAINALPEITEDTLLYVVYDSKVVYDVKIPNVSQFATIATYPVRLGQKLYEKVPAIAIGDDLSYYDGTKILPTTDAGLTFNGWYEMPTNGNMIGITVNTPEMQQSVVAGKNRKLNADHDVAAEYVAYTNTKDIDAVLDAKGGVFADGQEKNIVKIPYGENIAKYIGSVIPTKVGYNFQGWNLKGLTVMPNKATTFEALWNVKAITVKFVDKDGKAYSTKGVTYDSVIELPKKPTAPVGQEFDGWVYVDGNGNEMPIVANALWQIDAAEATITPKFEYIDYTITFDAVDGAFADGTSKKEITAHYGDNVLGLVDEEPTAVGYNFKCWKADSTEVADSAIVTTNVVLKADYQVKVVKVNFYDPMAAKPNVAIGTANVKYGKLLMNAISAATWAPGADTSNHTGYEFNIWVDEAGNEYENDTPILEDDELLNLKATYTPKTYTLTFDPNGGVIPNNADKQKTVSYGEPFGTLLDETKVTRTGYTLTGWKDGFKNDIEATTPYNYTVDGTIYAQWKANTYTITFNPMGGVFASGEETVAKTVTYDEAIGTLPVVTKTGYTFDGWTILCKDNNVGYIYKDVVFSEKSNVPAKNIVASATWVGTSYVIKFNANGGKYKGNNLNVQYGKDYKLPTEKISREGYDFLYWTSDEAGTTRVYDGVYNVLGDSTYYAKWQVKQYTVTFDPNNAAATSYAGTKTYKYGDKITPAELFTIPGTYAGYKHTGRWYVVEGENTKVFLPDFNYGIKEDITVKAEWEPAEFTITYKTSLEGTTAPAPIKVKYGTEIVANHLPVMTKTGYTHNGWKLDGNLVAESTEDAKQYWLMTKDITLDAVWDQPTYTLTFNYDNGTASTTKDYHYGDAIEFPADPTKTGYTFNGWKFGSTMIEKTGAWFSYLANTTFVADWTQINYSITYAFKDGVTPNQTVEGYHYGEPIVLITEPTWIGHTFNCWKCNGAIMHAGDTFEFTDNVEFVADWTTDTYTLTFKYNNGDEVKGTAATADLEQTYVYGQNIALPNEPSKTGYTFDGWYIGETKLTGASQYKYTGNKQAIAKWTAIKYDVTFKLNDDEGTVSGPWEYTYGEQIAFPSDPTKTGYTFDAWFKGTQRLTSSAKLDVTESIVIDAKYNKKVYTVVIDSNAPAGEAYITGNKEVDSFTIEYLGSLETAKLPNNLYRKGYHFKGWYLNEKGTGDRITAADVWSITEYGDTVYLYAGWEAEKYNINFVLNSADTTKEAEWLNKEYNNETLKTQIGADKFANKTVTYGQNIKLPAAADMKLKGYTFAGWYWNENGATDVKPVPDGKWLFDAGEPNAEVYIFAKWNAVKYTVGYDVIGNIKDKYNTTEEFTLNPSKTGFDIYYDTFVTADMLPDADKAGYIFNGWDDADGDRIVVGDDKLNNTVAGATRWVWTDDEKIEANWTAEKYTITFVEDGDNYGRGINEGHVTDPEFDHNIENLIVTYDAQVTLPTIPEVTGYDSAVWFDQQGTTQYASTNAWKFDFTEGEGNGTATFYVHWTAHTNTVKFSKDYFDGCGLLKATRANEIKNANGEVLTDELDDITVTFDKTILAAELPVLTLKGYEFLGWFNGDDEIEAGEYWKFDTETTLKAKWKAETYTEGIGAFDAVGSLKGVDGEAETEDDLYYKPEKLVFTTTAPVTVTYDTVIAEDKFPADPTLEGYTFKGWLYNDDGIEKNIGTKASHVPFEADLTGSAPITLKAKWEAIDYTVTINPGEGATVDPTTMTVTYGQEVELPTPTKTGYVFAGWYYYTEGENTPCIPVLDGIWTEPTTDVHAHWIAKGYTVYFNPGTYGSVSPKSKAVVYDQPYGWLPTPEYGSYTFLGWVNQNNVLVDSTTTYKIDGDSTLYASFRGSSRIILDYRNMAGLELSMDDVEEVFLGEVPETVETLVPEVVEEAKEEAAEEVVEEVAEEVTEEAAEEVVETPAEEVVEETTEVVLENRNSANAVVIDGGDEVAVKEALEEALETEEVVVIKDGEDTKAVKVIGYNAEKDNFEVEEVTEINPDTGAPVSANIAPAMFALLAAAAFAFGKRK